MKKAEASSRKPSPCPFKSKLVWVAGVVGAVKAYCCWNSFFGEALGVGKARRGGVLGDNVTLLIPGGTGPTMLEDSAAE